MVWIKICGITSRADAEAISDMGADSLGFIFSTDSPRRVGLEKAKKVLKGARNISKTGVFVNEDIKKLVEYKNVLDLDFIQLSGDEGISYIEDLKNNLEDIKIIKSFRLRKDDFSDIKREIGNFLEFADYVLFDSYHKYKYGGTGKSIDWEGVRNLADPERLIISGGLDHENVSRALSLLDPFGVDASSRLEVSLGKKDLGKVRLFITVVRGSNK